MKILLIAYYYPPLSTGGTVRPAQMARYLPHLGHEVTVLTHTYGPTRLDIPGEIRVNDPSYNKERKGLKKLKWLGLRLFTEMLNRLGIYHSIYSWWKNRVIALGGSIIERVEPEVIIATYPPVETLEIGLALSRKYNIPLVADFRDGLLFEPIETKRMGQYACIREAYARIEKETAMQAAAITAIASPITDYFAETYGVKEPVIISNGFDRGDFEDLPGDIQFDPSCFNLVFTGRFALSDKFNRVDYFFQAVRNLIKEHPDIKEKLRIHLVGEFRKAEYEQLKDLLEAGIILPYGFLARKRALAFQEAADALLIITPPDRRSATSIKIFEYLCSGKPTLALTHETVLADIIDETGAGWIVHPHHIDEISQILFKLIAEPGFYENLKPNPGKIEQYSMNYQMEKLARLLEKINPPNENNE